MDKEKHAPDTDSPARELPSRVSASPYQAMMSTLGEGGDAMADQMANQLANEVANQVVNEVVNEQRWRQANFDALTGLPNRYLFQDRLHQELKKAQRDGALLALLYIDLDAFHQLNDRLGREQGDALLLEAAVRINRCMRAADTVARLGGDQFAVILSGLDHVVHVERVAHHILASLGQPFPALLEVDSEAAAGLSGCIGLALYPADADQPEQLLQQARLAMGIAKKGGRGRYSYFTPDLQLVALARQQAVFDLRLALADDQFELHYQPIVHLQTGQIARAEALLRWRHPQRGLLAPSEFLGLAEAGGLMAEIGDWVFRQAATQLSCWHGDLTTGYQVSVNLSPAQLRAGGAAYRHWGALLDRLDLPPHAMVIEIAESVMLDGSVPVEAGLRQLVEMGLQVGLDNFGTGHASLAHLTQFGIRLLKLDRSFIQNVALDSEALSRCEALIMLAHKLGLRVVACGVETVAQCALLEMAGCDYAQGFVFAHAMPAAQFSELAEAGWNGVDLVEEQAEKERTEAV